MNLGACTERALAAQDKLGLFNQGVAYAILAVCVLAVFVAVAISPFLRRRYDRQVRRLMQLVQVAAPPPQWLLRHARSASPDETRAEGIGISSETQRAADLQGATAFRRNNVKRATWIAYGAFVGLFALVIVPIARVHSMGETVAYLAAVALLATLPATANIHPRSSSATLALGMLAMVIAWVIVGAVELLVVRDPGENGLNLLALGLLVFLVFYAVTMYRTLRAFIVPTTVLAACSIAGLFGSVWLVTLGAACMGVRSSTANELPAESGVVIVLAVLASYWGGVKVLDGVARLHERGLISDISLATATGFTTVALFAAAEIEANHTSDWRITVAALVWTALSIGVYAWAIRRGNQPVSQRSLLMLRVFSMGSATERLLDVVQSEWRYVGPTYQIGGPDLARVNISTFDFVRFVTGRLHDAFLLGAVDRAYLARRLAHGTDREGRFSVNAVLCLDSAWRTTVEQLMEIADVILVDVRRFSRARSGMAFEIALLVQRRLLQRTVVIGDASTDWDYFDALIRNAGGSCADILRQQVEEKGAPERCLAALIGIASQARSADIERAAT